MPTNNFQFKFDKSVSLHTNPLIGFAVAALILIGLAASYIFTHSINEGGAQVACTADAMECPDGSFVGRSGPYCEFICPGK